MNEYFTKEEIAAVKKAMADVSGASISIDSHSGDDQLSTFFDKAKLWRVIERIISALYIKRLAERKMFLRNEDGDEYMVVPRNKEGM